MLSLWAYLGFFFVNSFILSIFFGSLEDGNKGGAGGNSILGIGLAKALAIFSNALSIFGFLLFAERNVAIKN